ncbi:hypothetical protein Nmel_014984 [Mimus melanotis]
MHLQWGPGAATWSPVLNPAWVPPLPCPALRSSTSSLSQHQGGEPQQHRRIHPAPNAAMRDDSQLPALPPTVF